MAGWLLYPESQSPLVLAPGDPGRAREQDELVRLSESCPLPARYVYRGSVREIVLRLMCHVEVLRTWLFPS